MLRKSLSVLLIFVLIMGISSISSATELKTTLNVIQQASETKYLENDQGYISKTIVDSNAETGEVTVELKVSNTTNNSSEEKTLYENTEIYIIVNENIACNTEKLNTNVSYINTLATKIFNKNANTKIGIIGMKGPVYDAKIDEDGHYITGENDEGDVAGTANNAEVIASLTNNLETIKSSIYAMNTNKVEYRTNLQAAIKLANNSYSRNVNKILISLYDGVPSVAIGVKSGTSWGGWSGEFRTAEEAVVDKHEKIATNTRNEILSLKNNNVEFILLRPDDTSYDETWYNTLTGEKLLDFDRKSVC